MGNMSFWNKVEHALRNIVPVAQDSSREWVRKVAFLLALFVFIGSGWYLVDDLWVQPEKTKATANTLRDWFYTENGGSDDSFEDGPDTTVYPDGMMPKFKALYRANADVRGWIRFQAGEGDGDLFAGAVDNPIVQTTDNDYYLNRDYWGKHDKAGTLFFDYRNKLGAGDENRNLIVYGHNLKSGLMFSHFNKLASAKLERGRQLTTLTLDTLYDQREYKVFAVMVLNVNEDEGPVFNYLRTVFSHEDEFLAYVAELRKRSLFDFNGVDVQAGDELLTLSTCSNKRDTTLKDGRVVIVARRVREGEDPTVDTMQTAVNDDVLMPRAWYVNKGLPIPSDYASVTTPTTGTVGNDSTTTVTGGPTVPTDNTTTTPTTRPTGNGEVTAPTTVVSQNDTTTTTVEGETTTTAEGETTTTVEGETTTTAEGETTTTAEGETTTTAEGETTTTAEGETTTTAEGETTTTAEGETTTTEETTATTAEPTE